MPELVGAIKHSKAPRLYICNLMTQPGETDGLDVRGHIRAIEAQLANLGIEPRLFNAVLAYRTTCLIQIWCATTKVEVLNQCVAIPEGLRSTTTTSQPRCRVRPTATAHDSRSLALAVMRFYRSHRSQNAS